MPRAFWLGLSSVPVRAPSASRAMCTTTVSAPGPLPSVPIQSPAASCATAGAETVIAAAAASVRRALMRPPPVKASIPSVCRCSRRAATWLVEGGGGILQNEGALIQAALTRFASKLRYPSPGSGRRNEDNALLLLRPLVGEGYGDLARKGLVAVG